MLRENPFFILNIPLSADKHTIYARADDLSLLLDPAVCDEAAAELSSPLRRLEAELDWFPEDEEAVIDLIREDVSAGRSVSPATIEKLSPSGRLNAALYNLAVPVSGQGRVSTVNLETGVREIDSLIDNCSLADIRIFRCIINFLRFAGIVCKVCINSIAFLLQNILFLYEFCLRSFYRCV